MRIVVGIDPGLDGGVAVIDEHDALETAHLPTIESERVGRLIDAAALTRWISERDATEAVIERAQPMPDQGIVGAFSYGTGFGQLIAVLQGLLLPVTFVHPLRWKRRFGLANQKGKRRIDKDASRQYALDLWGKRHALQFAVKKDIHRAEAALLAYWQITGGSSQ